MSKGQIIPFCGDQAFTKEAPLVCICRMEKVSEEVFRQKEMRRGKSPRMLGKVWVAGYPCGGKHRQVEVLGLRSIPPSLRGGGDADEQHFMMEWS